MLAMNPNEYENLRIKAVKALRNIGNSKAVSKNTLKMDKHETACMQQ